MKKESGDSDRKQDQQLDDAVPAVIIEQPKADDAAAAKQKRHRRRVRAFRSFIFRLLALMLVVYILVFHIVGITLMPNGDMSPRLDAGDLLLFYRVDRKAKSQDIVVIDKVIGAQQAESGTAEAGTGSGSTEPDFFRKALNWLGFKDPNAPPTQRYVCRVVACAGDVVDVTEEQGLVVNGNAVVEANIFHPTRPYEGKVDYPVKLADGQYFVMADLRNGGMDSRYFGPVSQDEIQGIVITLLRRNNL